MSALGHSRPNHLAPVLDNVRYASNRWGNRPAFLWKLKILGAALQADGETRSVVTASSIGRRSAALDPFAGLDVSVKETSICIVDDTGRIVREVKVASEPEALLAVLKNSAANWTRSRTAIAMAVQCSRRGRAAGDLRRDAAHAGGVEGADQQDRS